MPIPLHRSYIYLSLLLGYHSTPAQCSRSKGYRDGWLNRFY